MESTPSFKELLARGIVHLFGYEEDRIPDILARKGSGRVVVFHRAGEIKKGVAPDAAGVRFYHGAPDLQRSEADVCFLDHEAIMALAVKFPSQPVFVLVRVSLRKSWFFGLIGLCVRLLERQISIKGIARLTAGEGKQTWMVLERKGEHRGAREFLSSTVGVHGFLKFLSDEKIQYVVLQSYEGLPDLPSGKDLDLLVSDAVEQRVRNFIQRHTGTIPVDVASISFATRGIVPHYPPPLARKILESAREGPGGSRIPGLKEGFLSFAYHVLYHLGGEAGVPTSIPGVKVNEHPKNDYAGVLARMARELHVDVAITMEGLDEYLHQEGWRPMRDTLALIAGENEWVKERFFSGSPTNEVGLGVIVLRKSSDGTDIMDAAIAAIEKEKFVVITKKKFNERERERATRYLRGGNWAERGDLDEGRVFLPTAAIVVLDMHSVYAEDRESGPGEYSRLRRLKDSLRSRFGKNGASLHSTDISSEAWDYIAVCFPEEIGEIRREVEDLRANLRLSLAEKLALYFRAAPYILRRKILRMENWASRQIEKMI
jgi:hypothetical protein